jgi:hypothetical protein
MAQYFRPGTGRPLTGPNGEPIRVVVQQPARQSRLVTQARKMEERFAREMKKGGFIEQTNRESLHWIQKKALENLEQSMATNRRPSFPTHKLEKAIVNDKYSTVSPTEIQFLVREKIFPVVPYYASLEYGDRSQIGRDIFFLFLGVRKGADDPNTSGDSRRIFNRTHKPSDVRNNRSPHVPHTIHSEGDGGLHESRRAKTVTFGRSNGVSDRLVGPREYDIYGKAPFKSTRRFRVIIRRPVPRYAYGTKAGDLFLSSKQYKQIFAQASAEFAAQSKVTLD